GPLGVCLGTTEGQSPHVILARLVMRTTPSKKFRNQRPCRMHGGISREWLPADWVPSDCLGTRRVAHACCGVVSNGWGEQTLVTAAQRRPYSASVNQQQSEQPSLCSIRRIYAFARPIPPALTIPSQPLQVCPFRTSSPFAPRAVWPR